MHTATKLTDNDGSLLFIWEKKENFIRTSVTEVFKTTDDLIPSFMQDKFNSDTSVKERAFDAKLKGHTMKVSKPLGPQIRKFFTEIFKLHALL